MCAFAYIWAMIVYQIGGLITGEATFSVFTVVAAVCLVGMIYLLVRKGYQGEGQRLRAVDAVRA